MADPSMPAQTPNAADSRQRIDDEHRHLNELLAELTATRDLVRVETLLSHLRVLLVTHFATEEAPEGLHELVSQQAAHRLPNLQHLFAEHRDFLTRLDRLRDDTVACLGGPVAKILDGVAGLAAALRQHELEEEELFGEAFYTDIGGRA